MDVGNLLSLSIRLTAPVLLIALGGMFVLKVGVFNLALDGFALFGCFASVVGAYVTKSVTMGVLFAVVSCIVLNLIYSLFVFELKVDAVICAIAFITIANGLTRYLLIPIFGASGRYILDSALSLQTIRIGLLERIPFIGPILNNHSALVYFGLIAPFLVYVLMYRTRLGLNMRAVGSNAEVAVSAGINVRAIQYFASVCNGFFCGLAGAQLALSLNMFNVGMTDGRGFTALAVLIMTNSHPIWTLLASLMFGLSDALVLEFSGEGFNAQLLKMLPYVLALAVAVVPLVIRRITMGINRSRAERRIMMQTGK